MCRPVRLTQGFCKDAEKGTAIIDHGNGPAKVPSKHYRMKDLRSEDDDDDVDDSFVTITGIRLCRALIYAPHTMSQQLMPSI